METRKLTKKEGRVPAQCGSLCRFRVHPVGYTNSAWPVGERWGRTEIWKEKRVDENHPSVAVQRYVMEETYQ